MERSPLRPFAPRPDEILGTKLGPAWTFASLGELTDYLTGRTD